MWSKTIQWSPLWDFADSNRSNEVHWVGLAGWKHALRRPQYFCEHSNASWDMGKTRSKTVKGLSNDAVRLNQIIIALTRQSKTKKQLRQKSHLQIVMRRFFQQDQVKSDSVTCADAYMMYYLLHLFCKLKCNVEFSTVDRRLTQNIIMCGSQVLWRSEYHWRMKKSWTSHTLRCTMDRSVDCETSREFGT